MRRHSSFLLRCWDLGSDGERIEVEHIQSGTRVLVTSVAAAVEWVSARGREAATQQEPANEQAGAEIGNKRQGGGSASFERQ